MCRSTVVDAIGDINLYMGWHIAEKAVSRVERELEEKLKMQEEI